MNARLGALKHKLEVLRYSLQATRAQYAMCRKHNLSERMDYWHEVGLMLREDIARVQASIDALEKNEHEGKPQ